MEELKKQLQTAKINKVSENIVKNKEIIKKQEMENKDEVNFDLWPEITKAYVKDEDEDEEKNVFSEDLDNNDVIDLHL